MSAEKNILDLCRRLRFEIADAPEHLVALFDSFSAAIVAAPLEEPPWRDRGIDGRRSLLAGEAFPGASAKSMIRIDLLDGRTIEGKSAGYCPAVEIWTTEGIQRIDVLNLPEDLRRCFEGEVEGKYLVQLRECIAITDKAADRAREMNCKLVEYQDATDHRIELLSGEMSEMEVVWQQIAAENFALQDENTRLRAELEEIRRSRAI